MKHHPGNNHELVELGIFRNGHTRSQSVPDRPRSASEPNNRLPPSSAETTVMRSTTFRNSERLQSQARQTAGPRNAAKHKIDSTQRRERVNTREVQEEGTVAKQRSTQYHLNATIAEQRCAQYQFEVTDTQVSSPHTLLDCHSAETIYSSLGTSAKAFMGSFQLEPYAKVNEIPLQQDSTQTVDRPKVNPTPDIAEDPANSPRQVNPTFPVEPTTQ